MKKFSLIVVLLVLALALSAAPAKAQPSQCGGNPNCFYAYVLSQCMNKQAIPNLGTVQTQVKATNSTTVNTYTLVTEWAGGNQRLYSVLITNVSSSLHYDARFLRNGSAISSWTYVGKPPNSYGIFYPVYNC